MQSITTLISYEHALQMAREAVDAVVRVSYPADGKIYLTHLDTQLRVKFAEPELPCGLGAPEPRP